MMKTLSAATVASLLAVSAAASDGVADRRPYISFCWQDGAISTITFFKGWTDLSWLRDDDRETYGALVYDAETGENRAYRSSPDLAERLADVSCRPAQRRYAE